MLLILPKRKKPLSLQFFKELSNEIMTQIHDYPTCQQQLLLLYDDIYEGMNYVFEHRDIIYEMIPKQIKANRDVVHKVTSILISEMSKDTDNSSTSSSDSDDFVSVLSNNKTILSVNDLGLFMDSLPILPYFHYSFTTKKYHTYIMGGCPYSIRLSHGYVRSIEKE